MNAQPVDAADRPVPAGRRTPAALGPTMGYFIPVVAIPLTR